MKYKDYYAILGVERGASVDEIKKRYRILARKYHPDVSKEPEAEKRFKEVAEAYATLKDADKRAAYDNLGQQRPGEDFRPPPEWSTQFGSGAATFDEMDLADLFAGLAGRAAHRGAGGRHGPAGAMRGQDYEVTVPITLEEAYQGTEVNLDLTTSGFDGDGTLRRAPKRIKARIPKGPVDGQVLRLPGQGGKGINGGADGDVYLNIALRPHRLYRVSGRDLYLDLPLAPWEAALGGAIEVPTLAGPVELKVPPGTRAGQQLRLSGRGLPKPEGGASDLFAVVQIVLPSDLSNREKDLYKELASASAFDPRRHFRSRRTHVTIDYCDALWPDPHRRVPLRELADVSGLSEAEVVELVEYGALAPADATSGQLVFSVSAIFTARTAHRLGEEFALEPHATALLLAYVDRIRELEDELRALRARTSFSP